MTVYSDIHKLPVFAVLIPQKRPEPKTMDLSRGRIASPATEQSLRQWMDLSTGRIASPATVPKTMDLSRGRIAYNYSFLQTQSDETFISI